MKRSFIIVGGTKPQSVVTQLKDNPVVKQIFDSLSDRVINELYEKYSSIDGKHKAFKGTKREYCMTVAGLIGNFLLENNLVKKLSGGNDTLPPMTAAQRTRYDNIIRDITSEEAELTALTAAKATKIEIQKKTTAIRNLKIKKDNIIKIATDNKIKSDLAKEQAKEEIAPFKSTVLQQLERQRDIDMLKTIPKDERDRETKRTLNRLRRERGNKITIKDLRKQFITERLGDFRTNKESNFTVRATKQKPDTQEYYPETKQQFTTGTVTNYFADFFPTTIIKDAAGKIIETIPTITKDANGNILDSVLKTIETKLFNHFNTYYETILSFKGNWSAETTFLITAGYPKIGVLSKDGQETRARFVNNTKSDLKQPYRAQGSAWDEAKEANFILELKLLTALRDAGIDPKYTDKTDIELVFEALGKILSLEMGSTQVDFSSDNLELELKGNAAGKEVAQVDASKVAVLILKAFKDNNTKVPREKPKPAHISFCFYTNNTDVVAGGHSSDNSSRGIIAYVDWNLNKIISDRGEQTRLYLNNLRQDILDFCEATNSSQERTISERAAPRVIQLVLAHYNKVGQGSSYASPKAGKDDWVLNIPLNPAKGSFADDFNLLAYDPKIGDNITTKDFLTKYTTDKPFFVNRADNLLGIEPLKVVDNIEEILTLGPGTRHPIRLNTLTATEEDKLVPFNQAAADRKAKKTAITAPAVAPAAAPPAPLDPLAAILGPFTDPVTSSAPKRKGRTPKTSTASTLDPLDASLIDEWKKEFDIAKDEDSDWEDSDTYVDMSIKFEGKEWDIKDINNWQPDFKERLLEHIKGLEGHGKPKVGGRYTPKPKAYKKKIIKYY